MQGLSAWSVWPDAGLERLEGACSLMQGWRVWPDAGLECLEGACSLMQGLSAWRVM